MDRSEHIQDIFRRARDDIAGKGADDLRPFVSWAYVVGGEL